MSRCTATRLATTAVVVTMAWPAMAQDVGSLVTFRADNRSGSAAAAEVIAEMIAERSQSAAVQNRARALAPQGTLELGPTELLLDIGAHGHIAAVTNAGAVAQPAVLRPATEPRPVAGRAGGGTGRHGTGSGRARGRTGDDAGNRFGTSAPDLHLQAQLERRRRHLGDRGPWRQ